MAPTAHTAPLRRRPAPVALVALLAVLAGTLAVLVGPSAPASAGGPWAHAGPGLSIPDSGRGSAWPSRTGEVDRGTRITDVSVTITGLHHTCVKDLDIALLHNGGRTILLSDVGEKGISIGCHDVHITELTIDDDCPAFPTAVPTELRTLPGGPLCAQPTDVDGTGHEGDTMFEVAADATPAAGLVESFDSPVHAEGAWDLYVVDDSTDSQGSIDGWAINVTTTDRPPTAGSTTVQVYKGTPVDLPFAASDPDGLGVTCEITAYGTKGNVDQKGCGGTYTASDRVSGTDTVSYIARDRTGAVSPTATMTFEIVNRKPVPNVVNLTVRVGQTIDVIIGGTDPDPNETVRCDSLIGADLGTTGGTGCNRTFTAGTVTGVDELGFNLSDGYGGFSFGTAVITVIPDGPVADAKAVTAPKGGAGTAITLTGTDPDGLPYGCEADALTAGRKGTLTGSGCERTYTPKPGTSGTDTFTYLIRNSRGVASARATVTVTIPNRAPATLGLLVGVLPGERIFLRFSAFDPDGEPVTCAYPTPALGTLEGASTACQRTYVAGAEQGTDTLRVTVTDPLGATTQDTVEVRVVDERPTAPPVAVTARKGSPTTFTLGSAAEGHTCPTLAASAQGKVGLTQSDCSITVTALAQTSGTDTISYTLRDGFGRVSKPGTITVTIGNRAPTAPARSITVLPGDSAAVALGGTDPDPGEGVALTCTPTTGPTARGRVGGTGCFATYTAGDATGTDSFAYTVRDPFGATATGTVTVTIAGTAPAGCTATDDQTTRYVCRTYTDLLGRPADASGKAYWVGRLKGGETRAAIIKSFTGTTEYRTSVVRGIWQAYLGTRPDAVVEQRWVAELGRGANPDLVRQDALASAAFLTRAGGTPEGFVQGAHQQLLRRPATSAEITTLAGQIRGGTSRSTIVGRLLTAADADRATVAAIYERFLRRTPPTVETDYWIGRLQRGESELALVRLIVASDEYFDRA